MPPFRDSPSLKFDAVANFRDMGGHTTRDGARVAAGRLFRSGHLAYATSADLSRLAELDLRKIFDFRNLADIEAEGSDRLPERFTTEPSTHAGSKGHVSELDRMLVEYYAARGWEEGVVPESKLRDLGVV